MATIARIPFREALVDGDFWPALARRALAWCADEGVALRDAIVLVPYAQLLGPARRAFAACGGWQPRIETTQTLAASLGPPPLPQAGQLRFDTATDRLAAHALMQRERWGAEWAAHDSRGFQHAAAALVDTAHALARAAAALPPRERRAHWEAARERLTPVSGPGAHERLLARVALEWAAASDDGRHDALFELRPSAWIVVRGGGEDRLATQLAERAGTPALSIDTDPPDDAPFAAAAMLPAPRLLRCDGLEDEAQASAAEVIAALQRGATPVVLIAQDRVLVRRVRALLERAGVALRDETGWRLSTTRAAASVMALLRAARSHGGADAWLDWLKSQPLGESDAGALAALERCWRRAEPLASYPAAEAAWRRARARLERLAGAKRMSRAEWIDALRVACGDGIGRLDDDAAGRQVLAALYLDGRADAAWHALAHASRLDLDGFIGWVDHALEQTAFLLPEADAPVLITPLARALLRPFGAVVFPAADERRLGELPPPDALLGDATARALGVPGRDELRRRETLAFAQLLRAPDVTLLHRRSDAGEPLGASPLVEHALLARRSAGADVPAFVDACLPTRRIARRTEMRPAPSAGAALPAVFSASAIDALRDCPYRFFARVVLGLRETPELEAGIEKRDYGIWLHAALHRFHAEREAPCPVEAEAARLLEVADAVRDELGFDEAELLPFRTTLERLAPLYADWLHRREAEGWSWSAGELERTIEPPQFAGAKLRGRIDRVDRRGGALALIDYKTVSTAELRKKVRRPLEDTQLAVYAALMSGEASDGVQAMYLAFDEGDGPQAVEHADVAATARLLLEGVAGDLERIRAGAGLAALGEGRLCEHCEARGLCRRDHWAGET